ncbi:MAG TPA: T9SS type A sorting domain-containing protein [Bacteroidia bacterium]|nr:T9SS type A sorting domain-containing protein [Bacteroidia bacterium]
MKKRILYLSTAVCLGIIFLLLMLKHSIQPGTFVERNEKETLSAWDALQFLSRTQSFPFQYIPPDAYQKGYEFYKRNFQSNSSAQARLAVSPWQNIGPKNVGGRTIGIAIDPRDSATIWLGAASGGLWKSTTGGIGQNAWTYFPTGYPVRGVSCILINPVNPDIMYIGTGESYSHGTTVNGLITRPTRGSVGTGILKSTDGGLTWAPSLDWQYNQARGIWDMQFNPLNPDVIYAATTEGIFKSNDAGNSWNQTLNQHMVMDLLVDPVDTTTIYAGVGNVDTTGNGIYRTLNSGASWTKLTNGLPGPTTGRITLAMNPLNHRSIIALIADLYSTAGIYRSYNKGLSWFSINGLMEIVSYQGWYSKGLCFKTDDSTRLLLGGVDVFRSDQSGDFPYQLPQYYQVHPDVHDIICSATDPGKAYIITDGGLYRTDDFGDNFYECTDGYVTSQAYIGSVSAQSGNLMLSGLQDNNTVRYDGNAYWTPVIGGDGSFNAIDPISDQYQYGSLQYLNILKSTDQGQNFNYIFQNSASPVGGNTTAFIAPFVLAASNSSVIYAGGDSLYRSDDAGFSFYTPSNRQIDSGNFALSITTSFTNEDSVYISTAPEDTRSMHVFLSPDGGQTFLDRSAGLPNRYPRDLAADPRDGRIVYVVFSGFGAGHVFKSTSAGMAWTDISTTLPDVPFHCITLDENHPDTLFAGSDLGVFVSADGGQTWDAFNNGLPDGVQVFDLQLSKADNSLVAFTHGNGTYKVELNSLPVGSASLQSFIFDFSIPQNPVSEKLICRIKSGNSSKAEFSIYSAEGRFVKKIAPSLIPSGISTVEINTNELAEGIYLVTMEIEGNRYTRKFLKVNR